MRHCLPSYGSTRRENMAMEDNRQNLFRKKAMDRISSPEQLTDYLRVTNPGIWAVLLAVILLLAGFFVWASVGELETTADVSVVVENHVAQVVSPDAENLWPGMPLRIARQDYFVAAVETDKYSRQVGVAEVDLPDGSYEGTVVVETIHPLDFLLRSR